MMRPDHFVPELWFLYFEGDELTGVALCYEYPDCGWVRQLAVAESQRKRGIGSALLRFTFIKFHERGYRKVALGVDSERIDAYNLYENVGMERIRQYDEYEKVIEGGDDI